jgi:hypothetical protein
VSVIEISRQPSSTAQLENYQTSGYRAALIQLIGYDGDGNRVSETVGGVITKYLAGGRSSKDKFRVLLPPPG